MTTALSFILALLALALVIVGFRQRKRVRELQAELDGTRQEMLDSTRLASLGNLVAGLVHEINTPIGALHSNHDVLKRALDRLQAILADEQVEPHELQEVRKVVRALYEIENVNTLAVERVDQLVKSLRSFGRPGSAEVGWANLHEGIDSTLAITRHELTGVEVVKDYGTLPMVLCRPVQLNQVFMNLVINARQAMRDSGKLTIRTRTDGDRVRISIADTGCGIPPENRTRIFQPGFTTKGARVGMGMGLLIARQIVEHHQGRIDVQSEVNKGTEFTITLPVTPSNFREKVTT
ncbi:MAG TPA: HAMP domain-containing sensor histidine kinase [Longimicrobiales bacterium]